MRQRSNLGTQRVPTARRALNRAGKELNATLLPYPSQESARRQQDLMADTFRRLGIGPNRIADRKVWASQAMNVLGPDSFAEFKAVRAGGKIIWCNFELARQLGFEVPQANCLTPDFEKQLLAALSFRVAEKAESTTSQNTITMYADRYGGDGVRPGLGAGRAGFLPYGNLYVKGVGFTPLFKHNDPNDFVHSHGAVYLSDCIVEAVFGEVNENLFTHGSARVVAIIDQSKSVIDPAGKNIPAALVVRAGTQLRPAHLLANRAPQGRSLLDKFVGITNATGQLVIRQNGSTGGAIPDVRATLLHVIDDHARTAAEGFRWRMIHGAISSSNMEMSGAMLDLPTQSSQPRTAPVWLLDYAGSAFGTEHRERALCLASAYRKLLRSTPKTERQHFNIRWLDISGEMEKAYARHLQVKLLGACGLKPGAAERVRTARPELASQFMGLLLEMSALKNPGSVSVSKSMVENVSILDVFHLMQRFPPIYFADPVADHSGMIFKLLRPVFKGNRFQIAGKQAKVAQLVERFANCYREMMNTCESQAREEYSDLAAMRASISARAAFENEPLDALYYFRLHAEIGQAIASYRANNDTAVIRQAIDQRIIASLRSVDALFAQGKRRRLLDGGIELERRTIEGINYSVRAWPQAEQTQRLHVSIPARQSGSRYFTAVAGLRCLTKRQIQSLRYRFTTDGRESFGEVGASLQYDEQDGPVIAFEGIDNLPLVGRLEGTFYMRGTLSQMEMANMPYWSGYVFAISDREELMRMMAGDL